MNNTNRALNRIGIFIFGLVLLAVGTAVAAAALLPDWLDRWMSVSSTVDTTTTDLLTTTTADGSDQSWLLLALPLLCLLLIALLVLFIFRQGLGHTRTLITQKVAETGTGERGTVTVDGKVAEQAIQDALDGHPGLLSSQVSTYLVGRTPTVRISTTVRRGVSPQEVRDFVDSVVATWDQALGREVPVFIQINAGMSTRTARAARFDAPTDTRTTSGAPAAAPANTPAATPPA